MAAKDLQKDIFLTCRSIFAGQNALIRKRKAVRDVLSQHKSKLVHLVSRHGWDKVTDVAKGLLERRIFESNLQAKGAFPELFETSPSRGAQRAASEIEAAHSEAEALAEAEPIDADWNSRRDTDGGLPINGMLSSKGPESFTYKSGFRNTRTEGMLRDWGSYSKTSAAASSTVCSACSACFVFF